MSRPDSPQWIKAAGIGDEGERLVAEDLKRHGFIVTAPAGKCSQFDLIGVDFDGADLWGVTVEVKTDARAAASGNLCVEVAHRGRPSGIRVSRADFFAFVLPDEEQTIYLPCDDLHDLVDSGTLREVGMKTEPGKRLVLVPMETARRIAVEAPTPRLWREGVARG